jgi:hypothetical protein
MWGRLTSIMKQRQTYAEGTRQTPRRNGCSRMCRGHTYRLVVVQGYDESVVRGHLRRKEMKLVLTHVLWPISTCGVNERGLIASFLCYSLPSRSSRRNERARFRARWEGRRGDHVPWNGRPFSTNHIGRKRSNGRGGSALCYEVPPIVAATFKLRSLRPFLSHTPSTKLVERSSSIPKSIPVPFYY